MKINYNVRKCYKKSNAMGELISSRKDRLKPMGTYIIRNFITSEKEKEIPERNPQLIINYFSVLDEDSLQ